MFHIFCGPLHRLKRPLPLFLFYNLPNGFSSENGHAGSAFLPFCGLAENDRDLFQFVAPENCHIFEDANRKATFQRSTGRDNTVGNQKPA